MTTVFLAVDYATDKTLEAGLPPSLGDGVSSRPPDRGALSAASAPLESGQRQRSVRLTLSHR